MSTIFRERKLPLWEEKWSKKALIKRRSELTAQAYARGFEQKPFSDEDRLFDPKDVEKALKLNLSIEDVRSMNGFCYTGVDLSGTKRRGVCLFTIKVVHIDNKPIRHPIDIRLGTFKGQEIVDQFIQVEAEWQPQLYLVESNSLQERIIDLLSIIPGTSGLTVEGYMTGKQTYQEDEGLPALSVEFQNELWSIPYRGKSRDRNPPEGHGWECNCGWCEMTEELLLYPLSDASDVVMAMFFAREAYRKYGEAMQVYEHWEPPTVLGRFRL